MREAVSTDDLVQVPTIAPTPGSGGGGGFWGVYLRRPLGVVAGVVLILIVLAVVFARVIAPYDPLAQDLLHALQPPSTKHLLGTDQLGRDVLSRLLVGGQSTLVGALEAVGSYLVIGVVAGIVAGYSRNWLGRFLLGIGNIFLAIPTLILLLVIVSVYPANQLAPMIALGVLSSAGLTRVVRSVTLATRNELYVDAARVNGLSEIRIMARHIAPRVFMTTAVHAALFVGAALVVQCGLAFLGFTVQAPAPSWGGMVSEAAANINRDPWFLIPAGAAIGITVLASALVGDALSDAFNSRATARRPTSKTVSTVSVQDVDPVDRTGTLLSVRDLSVAYAGLEVVSRVSFGVGRGETVGIVGESGCGKSTALLALIRMLGNTGAVTGGTIAFDGKELSALPERELAAYRGRRIGLVSQEPMNSLDPTSSVGALLVEAVRRHRRLGRSAAKAVALELLESVRLRDPAGSMRKYVHQLSGGMAQRVGIALALAGEPELLLADEPTSALDVSVRAEILALLKDLSVSRSMSVLVVTHDWNVVSSVCDRVVVMYAGQVVEAAATAEALRQPLNPYTAGLLASMPSRGVPGERLAAIAGSVPAPGEWQTGCRFAPRCPLATAACSAGPIPLLAFEETRRSRCIRVDELKGEVVS
jgi:peptide/nickel transport system permease protein